MAEPNTFRIVLLGTTGSGKSSLANILFGEENVFQVNHLPNSGPKSCESRTKTINGRSIQLIDTPGFFDTNPGSTDLSPELLKCMAKCAPGPHAFLLVMNMEKLEQAIIALTLKYFSEEALKFTTVVFTHGDLLPEGTKIEDYVGQSEDLQNLVQKCGGRCHVFDESWKNSQDPYRNNQNQIEQLLKTMRESGEEYYTNGLLQEFSYIEDISENDQICSLKNVNMGILLGAFLGAFRGTGSGALNLMPQDEAAEKTELERATPEGSDDDAISSQMEEEEPERRPGEKIKVYHSPCIRVGLIGTAFLAGKLCERWGSPTQAVRDMTQFAKETESMFAQLKNTINSAKGFANAAGM